MTTQNFPCFSHRFLVSFRRKCILDTNLWGVRCPDKHTIHSLSLLTGKPETQALSVLTLEAGLGNGCERDWQRWKETSA